MLTKREGSRSDLTRGMLVAVFNSKSNKGRMMDNKTEEPVNIEILQQGEILQSREQGRSIGLSYSQRF